MTEPLSDWETDVVDRIARLEKVVGASGYDIHEFDNAAQAEAHAAKVAADAEAEAADQEVAATPAAVAAADEHGVDLTEVEGTGADGKVVKADVVEAAAQ